MLSVTPDKSLDACLAAFRRLMDSGQYTRVADEMALYAKYLPDEIKNNVDFYTLAVAASLKAEQTDKAKKFHVALKQCDDYTVNPDAVEAEIARLVSKPSQDLIDRLSQTLKQWWKTRTTRR